MSKSGHILKTGIFALGLSSLILAPIASATADQRYNYRGGYNNHNYNRHNYNRHYRYGGGNYYRGRHHGGHGGEVALGVLTGGLLFYALTANNRRHYTNRTVYVNQQPTYVQQQPVYAVPAQPRNQYANSSCLQVREYQTTITVGGQNVPAYGQSCLQPDGTWKLGPAIPEPGN